MTTTEPGPRSAGQDLGDRTTYVGGSDVADILGLNPYGSQLKLWRRKRGLDPEIEETEPMRWGHLHEPTIANEFAVRTGKKVQQRRQAYVDREVPVIQGHIDRLVVGEDAILECKSTSSWNAGQWGEEGTDDIPRQHIVQVQTYLMLTGRSIAYVAVLIGGNDFRVYVVRADKRWHKIIREEVARFWAKVENGIEPDPADDAEAAARWDTATDRVVTADANCLDLLKQLEQAKAGERIAKGMVKELTVALQNEMEDAEAMMDPDGKRKLCTWRNSTRRSIDTKALEKDHPEIVAQYVRTTESRTFRLCKVAPKGGEA